MKKLMALLLVLALFLPTCVLAGSTDVEWTFGVALKDINETLLVLANSESPLTAEDIPTETVTLKTRKNNDDGTNANGGLYMASNMSAVLRRPAANALMKLMTAAESEGVILYVRGAYRSYEDQEKRYTRAEKSGDTSYMQKAGECDYQTGLAVMLVGRDWRAKTLTDEFAKSQEAKWLANNASRFGFIIRYPEGKESITGNMAEPWHLRYVGDAAAQYMDKNNLCLEEFCADFNSALSDFESRGGDLEAALAMGILPEGPLVLDETDATGDHEVILFHD